MRAGEIVGIAGVEGNGQLELVKVIMGLIEPTSGSIKTMGEEITRKPILEKRKRVAFVSQDRANMGASTPATITENVIMTHHRLNDALYQLGGPGVGFQAGSGLSPMKCEENSTCKCPPARPSSNRCRAATSKR